MTPSNQDPQSNPRAAFLRGALTTERLPEQIIEVLKAEILAGELGEGELHRMGDLADRFGVSRTPVREALLELDRRGLVKIIRGSGFRVTTPSVHELLETLEVREMLEIPSIERLAGNLSSDAHQHASDILEMLQRAVETKDIARFHELDRQFHVYLVSQLGNGQLTQTVERLREVQWMSGFDRALQLQERNDEHRQIFEAVAAGDRERAAERLATHLAFSRETWRGMT